MVENKKFAIGNMAAQLGAAIYEKKYNKKLIFCSASKDYKGGDCIDYEQAYIDWKNNHDSYIFQYTQKSGWASQPNPYPFDCITNKIFVYDERVNKEEIFEYTMDQYWARYYKDINCIPELKRFLSALRGPCTHAEYFIKAEKVIQFITPLIKDNIIIERVYENRPECNYDFKIRLKIK